MMTNNLIGQRFGKLLVLLDTGRKTENLKRPSKLWLCRCDCGREEEIPQTYLPTTAAKSQKNIAKYACSVCTRGECKICGQPILTKQFKGVCSSACHDERRREVFRRYVANAKEENPDYYKEQWQKRKAHLEKEGKYEDFLEYHRNRLNNYYALNREKVNAENRKKYWRNVENNRKRRRELYEANKAHVRSYMREYLFEKMEEDGRDMTAIDKNLGDGKRFWGAVNKLDYWRETFKNARIHFWN